MTAAEEIERISREYPDGMHTCAELQHLEPGRRPCTCGRCYEVFPPVWWHEWDGEE